MEGTENPFLARPDEHKAGAANEIYCWMHPDRECNGSCVAFDPDIERTGGPCLALESLCHAVEIFRQSSKHMMVKQKSQALADAIAKIPDPPEVK